MRVKMKVKEVKLFKKKLPYPVGNMHFLYCVTYREYDPTIRKNSSSAPLEAWEVYANKLDGHYVLRERYFNLESPNLDAREFDSDDVFGVCYTQKEANERIYRRTKKHAEKIAQKRGATTLEDLTHQFQRLPRGSK